MCTELVLVESVMFSLKILCFRYVREIIVYRKVFLIDLLYFGNVFELI